MTLPLGVMDSCTSAWPLELGLWTCTLRRGLSSWGDLTLTLWHGFLRWGYGLPRFDVAPCVGLMDSHTLVWPFEFWLWTTHSGLAPQVGVMNSHTLVWHLNLGRWTATVGLAT